MEWVEVRGSTVDVAVEAALSELGLASRDEATIEIVEEPAKGFLGMGSRDALVRVTRKPKQEKRQRRRKRGGGGSRSGGDAKQRQQSGGGRRPDERGGSRAGTQGTAGKSTNRTRESGKAGRERTQRKPEGQGKQGAPRMEDDATPEVSAEGQAEVVADFLNGLLDSFGLEGTVTTGVEDDVILADVSGEQTEALIGPKGSIMQSVGELTRTVVQRKTHRRARLRLDIGGYQERRREALRIYTARLAEQVLDDGGEIMLEPMNPADRKTVHDAVVEIEGVRSFSEGEEPNRSVVIALAPGVEPRSDAGTGDTDADADGDTDGDDGDTGDSEDE